MNLRLLKTLQLIFLVAVISALPFYLSSRAAESSAMETSFLGKNVLNTRMLLRVQERDFKADKELEYRIFEDGLVMKTVVYDGNAKKTNLFDTKIGKIPNSKVKKAAKFVEQLQETKFGNSFPWFESLDEKGNTVQIEFPGVITMDCFKEQLNIQQAKAIQKDILPHEHVDGEAKCSEGLLAKTFLYYTKHRENPKLFKEVLKFVKSL